jgi:uncharacterized protein YbjT (DUF2867 family)
MRIVLLGATGLVGNHLLAQLISADSDHRILALGRSKPQVCSELQDAFDQQVTFVETDLESKEKTCQIITDFQAQASADMLICCLGTTIRQAGSRQGFLHVDHDLVLTSAIAAQQCGIDRMILVSAINANIRSKVYYSKVKGLVEQSLTALGFAQLIVVKPSLLIGQRKNVRLVESLAAPIVQLMNPLLQGRLKKYRGIAGKEVAECMLAQLTNPKQGVLEVYPTDYTPKQGY